MHLRNIQIEDDDVSQKMDEMFRIAFEEDKVVLEAIQQEELRSTGEQSIKLAIDKAPNVYRLRIRRLIENELNKMSHDCNGLVELSIAKKKNTLKCTKF